MSHPVDLYDLNLHITQSVADYARVEQIAIQDIDEDEAWKFITETVSNQLESILPRLVMSRILKMQSVDCFPRMPGRAS